MRFLTGGQKPNPWGERLGLNSATVSRVFAGKQRLGAEALTQLAVSERVNLTWLLTGEGEPYAVLPIPDPATLSFGYDFHYYLFIGQDGLRQPLVRVGPDADLPKPIQVYAGDPGDLMRTLERLVWKQQPIHLAPASDQVIQDLRQGLASNRVLIDDGNGVLEQSLLKLDVAQLLAAARVSDHPAGYLANSTPELPEEEYEWLMLLRELPKSLRASLLDIARAILK